MSSASLTDSRAAQKEQLDEPKRPQSTAVMIEGGNSTPNGTRKQEYRETTEVVYLKKRFFWATVVASCFAAFAVGLFSRLFILDVTQRDLLQVYHDHVDEHRRIESQRSWQHELSAANTMTLPDPVMKRGKTIPRTTYTSKNFDTTSATTHSRWIVSNVEEEDCFVFPSGPTCTPTPAQISAKEPAQGVDQELIMEEEHLPAGQHLLLDLENIDSQFLNSEERLASAMLELVDQCGLTLLSYHCHKLQPSGVSCAGVLLESHVSFHTWPSRGVITIDLFTCGPNSLLPFVPTVENLFGVASSEAVKKEQQPKMVWAHKYRGFGERSDSAEVTDMFHFPVGQMSDFKEEVVSVKTQYQRMDVYDVLRPGVQSLELYKRSLLDDDSYEAQHPDLFAPDRIVFLDGVLQSRKSGDAAYHESLVHPAMFAHSNPKRVAIVGGGEGATLREVLKHNTVEKVVMIDIDEQMVNLSRKFLPFWSDCSMLVNANQSCFDNPRVETYYEDAFQWFIDRFSVSNGNGKFAEVQPFDVIIMDALDPQVQKEFAETLYNGGATIFSQGLDASGILIAQVGEANTIRSPSGEFSIDKNRIYFIDMLASLGFQAVRDYEESHNGFTSPWEFVVAFKESSGTDEWFSSSADIDLKIRKRGLVAVGGASPFLYFDGATMASYKYPSKGSEVSFCRSHPTSKECIHGHGFDPEKPDLPLSALLVKEANRLADNGVFARTDIQQDTYIGLHKAVPSSYMNFRTVALAVRLAGIIPSFWKELLGSLTQVIGGCKSEFGEVGIAIDSAPLCFINCHRTAANVGRNCTQQGLVNASVPVSVDSKDAFPSVQDIYNPAKARQVHGYSRSSPLRSIEKGEEILDECGQPQWFESSGMETQHKE